MGTADGLVAGSRYALAPGRSGYSTTGALGYSTRVADRSSSSRREGRATAYRDAVRCLVGGGGRPRRLRASRYALAPGRSGYSTTGALGLLDQRAIPGLDTPPPPRRSGYSTATFSGRARASSVSRTRIIRSFSPPSPSGSSQSITVARKRAPLSITRGSHVADRLERDDAVQRGPGPHVDPEEAAVLGLDVLDLGGDQRVEHRLAARSGRARRGLG